MAGTLVTPRTAGMSDSGYPTDLLSAVRIRQVMDEVLKLSEVDTDLIEVFGGLAGFQFITQKIEWFEKDRWSRRPTHGGLAAAGTTSITVTGLSHKYPVGTIFRMGTELVRVTAVPDANTLTLKRGYAGTTAAAQASTVEMIVAGATMNPNDSWVSSATSTPSNSYNYRQVWHRKLSSDWDSEATKAYGMKTAGDLDDQTMDAVEQALVAINQSIIMGERYAGGGADAPAMTGGALYYVTAANGADVTDVASGPLTLASIHDMAQDLVYAIGSQAVGKNALLLTDLWGKRKFDSFGVPGTIRQETDTTLGTLVTRLRTSFGEFRILPSISMPKQKTLFFGRPEFVKLGHMANAGPISGRLHSGDIVESGGPFFSRYVYASFGTVFMGIPTMGLIHTYSLSA